MEKVLDFFGKLAIPVLAVVAAAVVVRNMFRAGKVRA
jgi:hypothetical protein